MIFNHANIGGQDRSIIIEAGKITAVTDQPVAGGEDLHGRRVLPGLVDIHTHGGGGMDTMDADFAPLCRFYAAHGTTAFLPTTMTESCDAIKRATAAETHHPGAQILGFHLEGPFISEQYKGAQDPNYIRMPSVEVLRDLNNVKMITIAPELPGSEEFIRAVEGEMVVSLGHTACDYDTALRAIDCGARCLTHTYNAMPPLHHRAPGPIGAGLERHIYAQVICDGVHVAPAVMLAAYRMFGPDRMIIISDSIRCAGLPDGEYTCGGLPVVLRDGIARLTDGTIAGSCATLWNCVRTAAAAGIPFNDAVKMATDTPAQLLGIHKGRIAPGYDADLLLLNDTGEVETVIIGGEIFDLSSAS